LQQIQKRAGRSSALTVFSVTEFADEGMHFPGFVVSPDNGRAAVLAEEKADDKANLFKEYLEKFGPPGPNTNSWIS